MDALNPAKRRAAQRPTPQRVYVKVTSEFDATGYMQPCAGVTSSQNLKMPTCGVFCRMSAAAAEIGRRISALAT